MVPAPRKRGGVFPRKGNISKTYHVILTSKGFTGESPSEKAIEDKVWAAILADPKKYITLSTLEIQEPLGIYPGDEELIDIADLHVLQEEVKET
jgi:hypothetical protein